VHDLCSSEIETETQEEKAIRENPGVPVITNLEDLYKIPRLQKVQAEELRATKAAKLNVGQCRLTPSCPRVDRAWFQRCRLTPGCPRVLTALGFSA